MGCDCFFVNLTKKIELKMPYKNILRNDNNDIKSMFKQVIYVNDFDINDDVIMCYCCCEKYLYNNDELVNFNTENSSNNSKIQFFINFLNIKYEIIELNKNLLYKDFCIICRENVSKLYKNKNGLMTCNKC